MLIPPGPGERKASTALLLRRKPTHHRRIRGMSSRPSIVVCTEERSFPIAIAILGAL